MFRRIKRTLLDWLAYLAARTLASLFLALPWSTGRQVARLMGDMAHLVDRPSRRAQALESLQQAFPSLDREGAERMLHDVYRHLVESILDALHFARLAGQGAGEGLLECVGFDKLVGLPSDVGLIFVTGHLGQWEILGTALPLVGYPVWSVGRVFQNVLIDGYVKRLRQATGQRMLDKAGALRQVIRLLSKGANVGFMIDQDARREGIFVDFFGRPASTTPSVARISIRTGAPVVFSYARRVERQNRFRIVIKDVLLPRPGQDVEAETHRITQQITKHLEEEIRRAPSEWLWLHRRWKTYPGKYDRS